MTETETPTLGLDEKICFSLYRASRALTNRYRELLRPLGVTYPQYLVLLVLWEKGTVSVATLGERLQLDSGTLSPLLRRLETNGIVTRTRSAADERSVLVNLTPHGEKLHELASGIPNAVCLATGLQPTALISLQKQVAALADSVTTSL